jgi:hypothetical protein
MGTGKGTWKARARLTTVTALTLCFTAAACADTKETTVTPCRHIASIAPGATPPLVAYARESLRTLDEMDNINDRLRSRGGILGRLSTTIQGWLGDADIDRIVMLGADRWVAAHHNYDDDPFYRQMAEGTKGLPWASFGTNRAFITAARRDAHDIIDRYEYRDAFMAAHHTLLGSDAAYVAPRHADTEHQTRHTGDGQTLRTSDGWSITEID